MHDINPFVTAAIRAFDLIEPVEVIAQLASTNNLNLHLRAANGDFVLECYPYERQNSLFYEHQLIMWLARHPSSFGVPVPMIMSRSISYLGSTVQGLFILTPFIAGETPEFRLLNNGQQHPSIQHWAYAMGTALGELQTLLQACPMRERHPHALFQSFLNYAQPRYDPLQLSVAQVGGSSDDEALWTWWRMEATSLMAFVTNEYPSLPQQLCHNDFAPSNLLMRDGRVAAILDFEFACPAARALDVAMALRMIMQLDSNPANPWAVAAQFCCGYAEWITLTAPEIAAMPQLIGLRTAIPVIWAVSKTERPSPTSLVQAIRRMQVSKAWMSQHHPQLIALLQTAFAA
ncbi:MAG: phosphotransferase [Chloroflexi bacterium]|nr:phosphotransferase [Chloroflexota bacterium]